MPLERKDVKCLSPSIIGTHARELRWPILTGHLATPSPSPTTAAIKRQPLSKSDCKPKTPLLSGGASFLSARPASGLGQQSGAAQGSAANREVAEGKGFEPLRRLPAYTLSRRAPSTTRPSLRTGRLPDCRRRKSPATRGGGRGGKPVKGARTILMAILAARADEPCGKLSCRAARARAKRAVGAGRPDPRSGRLNAAYPQGSGYSVDRAGGDLDYHRRHEVARRQFAGVHLPRSHLARDARRKPRGPQGVPREPALRAAHRAGGLGDPQLPRMGCDRPARPAPRLGRPVAQR